MFSRWIWQHSVEDLSYANWAPSTPDRSGNEKDCARMDGMYGFMWLDVDCKNVLASPLCQRDTNL